MKRIPIAAASGLGAVLLVISLAGCAPASTPGAGGTTGPASSAPVGKPAATGSSDGACKYLSIADLDSLTGRSYATSTNVPLHDPIEYSYCAFKTTGKAEFDLLVSNSDPTDVMAVENEAAGNKLAALSGVGDSALSDNHELVVQFGQDVIAGADDTTDPGMHPLSLAQLKSIAARTHSHM